LLDLWRQEFVCRIGAHTTCIGTTIAVKNSLVIAGRHQGGATLAIRNYNKRQLFALKCLLQQQAFSARSKLILVHRSADKVLGGRRVLSDKYSLAGAQTICLYDHRPVHT